MSFIGEVYQTARNIEVTKSLKQDQTLIKEATQRISEEVNKIADLQIVDMLAMMLPISVAVFKDPEYFGDLIDPNMHFKALHRIKLSEFADVQNVFNLLFAPTGVNRRFLFSFKEDKTSPVGFSVNHILYVIPEPDNEKGKQMLDVKDGEVPIMQLYTDTLEYEEETSAMEALVASNLMLMFVLTSLACTEPKAFEGNDKLRHVRMGSKTSVYQMGEGEVLFEVNNPMEAPKAWFEIFDKAGDEDFDLNNEFAQHINANLQILAQAK